MRPPGAPRPRQGRRTRRRGRSRRPRTALRPGRDQNHTATARAAGRSESSVAPLRLPPRLNRAERPARTRMTPCRPQVRQEERSGHRRNRRVRRVDRLSPALCQPGDELLVVDTRVQRRCVVHAPHDDVLRRIVRHVANVAWKMARTARAAAEPRLEDRSGRTTRAAFRQAAPPSAQRRPQPPGRRRTARPRRPSYLQGVPRRQARPRSSPLAACIRRHSSSRG